MFTFLHNTRVSVGRIPPWTPHNGPLRALRVDTVVCLGPVKEEKNESLARKLVTNVKQNLRYFVKNSKISQVVYSVVRKRLSFFEVFKKCYRKSANRLLASATQYLTAYTCPRYNSGLTRAS